MFARIFVSLIIFYIELEEGKYIIWVGFGGHLFNSTVAANMLRIGEEYGMNEMNGKMIDAVIKKAEVLCPDSLALIGGGR